MLEGAKDEWAATTQTARPSPINVTLSERSPTQKSKHYMLSPGKVTYCIRTHCIRNQESNYFWRWGIWRLYGWVQFIEIDLYIYDICFFACRLYFKGHTNICLRNAYNLEGARHEERVRRGAEEPQA